MNKDILSFISIELVQSAKIIIFRLHFFNMCLHTLKSGSIFALWQQITTEVFFWKIMMDKISYTIILINILQEQFIVLKQHQNLTLLKSGHYKSASCSIYSSGVINQDILLKNFNAFNVKCQMLYHMLLGFPFGDIHKPRGQLRGEGVSQMTIL